MQIFPTLFFALPAEEVKNNLVRGDFASLLKQEETKVNPLISTGQTGKPIQPKTSLARKLEQVQDKLEDKISEEEFSQVESLLQQKGVSKEKISLLKKKVEKQELTWKELLLGLNLWMPSKILPQLKLSTSEKQELLTFLQKIKFTPKEAENLLTSLSQKQTKLEHFFQKVLKQIDSLPEDSKVELNLKELKALSKIAGGHFEVKKVANFVGENSVSALKNLLLSLSEEAGKLLKANPDWEGLSAEQKSMLKNILALLEAKDKPVSQKSESFIKAKTEEGKVKGMEENDTKTKNLNLEKQDVKAKTKGAAEVSESKKDNEFNSKGEENQKDLTETKKNKKILEYKGEDKDKGKLEFSKVELVNSNVNLKDSLVDKLSVNNKISRQVWNQVEQAVWQNISKNNTRMVLRLNPPDLGKVGMVLQMNKGEVSLLLKSNNEEVGQVLRHNLHSLKAHLEQEGFRVQKMEVKTQLEQENFASFEHGQQFTNHNFEQQKNFETSIGLARLRYFFSSGQEIQAKNLEEPSGLNNKLSLFA